MRTPSSPLHTVTPAARAFLAVAGADGAPEPLRWSLVRRMGALAAVLALTLGAPASWLAVARAEAVDKPAATLTSTSGWTDEERDDDEDTDG
jgi:hypothetical protein